MAKAEKKDERMHNVWSFCRPIDVL